MNIFQYQNLLYFLKVLYYTDKIKNDKTVNNVNNALTELRNRVNRKEIPKDGNHVRVINIVEEILKFNIQQKRKRLPLNLARFFDRKKPQNIKSINKSQAGNTSENLLNEIRQIVYSLHRAKIYY